MAKRKLKKKRVFGLVFVILLIIGGFMFLKYIEYKNSATAKLLEIGYSKEQTKELLDIYDKNQIKDILTKEYSTDYITFGKEKYFIYSNIQKYIDYRKSHNNNNITDIVSIINVEADQDWYDNVKETKIDSNNELLILVNKVYHLNESYAPTDIVNTGLLYSYEGNKIKSEVYQAFINMYNAAKSENLSLIINSSYRTYATQKKLYDERVVTYGVKEADEYAARPGHSEHETGLALDIWAYNTDLDFEETEEFRWMQEHAHEYGFILRYPKGSEHLTGYSYESWHYRYLGIEMATKVKEEGITYDEYYAYYCEYKKTCY